MQIININEKRDSLNDKKRIIYKTTAMHRSYDCHIDNYVVHKKKATHHEQPIFVNLKI